ncbi:hypothetical protein [Hyphomicrobium sp. 2TAF46]|uniref:hypothetical protein n=1 Tax=Hyphomicrobium sp. 2TAF46 TaxID=3233019 RepID=UPI003F93E0C7
MKRHCSALGSAPDVLMEVVFRLRPQSAGCFLRCLLQCRAHRFATVTAGTAGIYTILHVSDFLATLGTSAADLGAGTADEDMLGNSGQQYRSRCVADFRTSDHQSKMIGLGVFASRFKAMVHGFVEASGGADLAKVGARPHFGAELLHRKQPPFHSDFCRNQLKW